MLLFSLLILAAALPLSVYGHFDCRPPGPIVPRPTNITSHPAFISAASNLTKILQSAVAGGIEAGWPVENTSFSVGFITRDQQAKNIPAWEFHFLAPNNVRGTKNITRNSQYLINSITKVISAYVLLRSGIPLDDPITKYIPELATNSTLFEWDAITLRHLATGLAGIPPIYGFSEMYSLKPYFERLGFPQVQNTDYPPCGVVGLNSPCTTQGQPELLRGISELHPVAKPASRPVYSNLAFFLFTHALQVATGKNYTTFLQELVTEPLGMSNTKASPGDDSAAVIPPIESLWGSPYAHNLPGAGLVSTLSDLTAFFHSILDRSIMTTETEVLEWLKPVSASSASPYNLVGMPWEIYREQNLTPKHPHHIDLYGKGGGAPGYRSQATVIDDYGVAVVVLTAGSPKAADFIHNAVLRTLIPVVDDIARDQAAAYTGTYISRLGEKSRDVVNVTVAQDRDSLFLQRIDRNGRDMVASYRELFVSNVGNTIDMLPTVARIYPTDITTTPSIRDGIGGRNNTLLVREEWRISWELAGNNNTALPGAELGRDRCWDWVTGDWVYYASESMDRIGFVKDASTGEVLGVELPVLRSRLLRKVTLLNATDGKSH